MASEKKKKIKQTKTERSSEHWDVKELKDLLTEKGYIRGPFGSALRRPELQSEGIPVYEQQNAIYDHRIFRFFIDKEKYEKLKRFTVRENDLIISCSGTFGKVSIIKKGDPIGIISQALLILRPDVHKVNPDFLKYFFTSKQGYNAIASRSLGSVQVNIAKREIIEKIELAVPPLSEQQAIAKILSNLDDKIKINQQMNKALEAIGQVLFKHWFIDFEHPNDDGKPYKFSGGEMVYSEELEIEIPKGWRVINLGEIIGITSGKRPDTKSEIKNEEYAIPVVGASKVIGYTNKQIYEKETIVIGRVGTHGIVQRFNEAIFPSDNTLVITTKYFEYVYQYLLRVNYSALNIGSTQPLITQTSIKKLQAILPVDEILVLFEKICNSLYKKYYENVKTSDILISIRDTLLPKLMSGKIRLKIPKAEIKP